MNTRSLVSMALPFNGFLFNMQLTVDVVRHRTRASPQKLLTKGGRPELPSWRNARDEHWPIRFH
ncbi:hypothetical protein QF001_004134 [Paraburkholderia youngii]